MRVLLKRCIRTWVRRCGAKPQCDEARFVMNCRAQFARRYRDVCAACSALEPESADATARLAGEYMSRVLEREYEPDWWRANAHYLAQSWFIWEYCLAQGMVSIPEPDDAPCSERVIRPEAQTHPGCVLVRIERAPRRSDTGQLHIGYAFADEAFSAVMRTRGLRWQDGGFVRNVNEWSAPVFDRAVENAVRLLDDGYAVCMDEPALEQAILQRRFEPEHRYWIVATSQPDKLRLIYPRDPRLHRYACQAGARWNGKYMEVVVCHADRLEELARLYGFRTTREARRRLDAWHEVVRQSTVMRPRGGGEPEACAMPDDMFKAILSRDIAVPDDLRDYE